MAIGLGLMMGFRFIENFNHPYISRSITEFWRRWHISLSTWLRDYLYIPLGGNKKGKLKTYRNLIVTMGLGGLWHGANWTFLLWGLWHGLLLSIERVLGFKDKILSRFMVLPTLILVTIGWVLFRAENVNRAFSFYKGMVGLNGFAVSEVLYWKISNESLFFFFASWLIIFLSPKFFDFSEKIKDSVTMRTLAYKRPIVRICVLSLFVLSLIKLSATAYSPFLYFQF